MGRLNDLQLVQLDILRVVNDILNTNKLQYFLIGGSCIGAIRHKGFIPWDDDIDIGLYREDYEKARELLILKLPKGYTYCDNRTEEEYPYNFGKVRKDNTAFVHGGDAHLNIHQGIYIDIFPFDNCPDNEKETKKFFKRIKWYRLICDMNHMSYKKNKRLRPLWQLPPIFICHLFNRTRIMNRIDVLCLKYRNIQTSKIGNLLSPYGIKEVFNKEYFKTVLEVPFENISSFVPVDYDSYLKTVFGNYMELPPVEQRISHHDAVYLSVEHSYCPY